MNDKWTTEIVFCSVNLMINGIPFLTAMEWVGPSRRTYAGIIMTFFGPVGYLYALLISYFARDWFWILLGVSLPFAILFLLYW